jgi:glycosyltransferase involved in cell wall biosynthesis
MTSAHSALDVRIFHKQCRSLVRSGYEVTLVAPGTKRITIDGVHLEPVPTPKNRWIRMACSSFAVYGKARRQNAAVYHFHDPELIPIALLLRLAGKKVIYDVHEDLPRTVSYKRYIPRFLRGVVASLLEALERRAARWFSALVTATTVIAKRFQDINKEVVVVHNYPRIEEIRAPQNDVARDGSLLYLGIRITQARGAEEMVRAMGMLPPAVPARLKFIGGWDPPALVESLSRIPGWERTESLGLLARPALSRLLHEARAGLALLHAEPNYVAAQPVKLFEYMCAGLPVIASDLPGCREIVNNARCGLLVNPLDPREIAEAITYLWTHQAEAEAMGQRGFEAIQRQYNWASEERILLQLYRRLCHSPQTAASPLRCAS